MSPVILQIAKREWKALGTESRYIWLILTASVLFVLVLGCIYSPKKLLHVPVLIVDQDHSQVSRELTSAILANETFSLGGYADSSEIFPAYVAEDRAHICFIFQRGLERGLLSHKPTSVEVLVDNSNYLAGSAQINAATSVLTTFSVGAEMRMLQASNGIKQTAAQAIAMPYDISTRVWFNPPLIYNYLNFMVGGLVYIVIQLSCLFLPIRSGAREFFGNRAAELQHRTQNVWIILAGKLLPYASIATPLSIMLICLPHLVFGVSLAWTNPSLWIVLLWYVLMLVMLGYGLSCLVKNPLFATEICASITMPNFLLSGYTWPVFAMPKLALPFAYALPMNSATLMMRKLSLMNGSLADCGHQIAGLTAWSLIALFLAWRGTRAIFLQKEEGHA